MSAVPPHTLPSRSLSATNAEERSSTATTAEQSDGKLLLGQVRTNGFERPFARDQVISWTGHSVSAACFYVAAMSFLVQGEDEASRGIVALVLLFLCMECKMGDQGLLTMALFVCDVLSADIGGVGVPCACVFAVADSMGFVRAY